MSIRLVNIHDDNFWLTSTNWQRLQEFAELHGWMVDPRLNMNNWGDGNSRMIEQDEFVGMAFVSAEGALALAEAIDRGLQDDLTGESITRELSHHAEKVRRVFPEYDPAKLARQFLEDFAQFATFARRGKFRVDMLD